MVSIFLCYLTTVDRSSLLIVTVTVAPVGVYNIINDYQLYRSCAYTPLLGQNLKKCSTIFLNFSWFCYYNRTVIIWTPLDETFEKSFSVRIRKVAYNTLQHNTIIVTSHHTLQLEYSTVHVHMQVYLWTTKEAFWLIEYLSNWGSAVSVLLFYAVCYSPTHNSVIIM